MAKIRFSPDAASHYERLDDDADGHLLARIDETLDALETDPGAAWLRRYRFSQPPLRGVLLRDRTRDWILLWSQDQDDPDVVLVCYLGPFRL